MAKGKKMAFEQSKYDKEMPGVKEGSKRDMAMDAKQKKAMPKFARGGGVEIRGKTRGKMC